MNAELFRLDLVHPYYSDGRCPDFALRPSAATARLLRNHRCTVKSRPDGLRVAMALDDSGAAFLPLDAGATFRFELELTGGDFAVITDMTGLDAASAPRFTNVGAVDETGGELALLGRDTDPDLPSLPRGVFAEAEIRLSDGGDVTAPREYQAVFSEKQTRWAYYCVTDLDASGGLLGLVDTGSGDTVTYSAAGRELADEPDATDLVAEQLPDRYPGLRWVRFVSDQAVACREAPTARLELQLDGVRLSGPLPTPPVRRFSKIDQEDSLYQIVRYLTQPL